jgi:hypothetical protein
LFIGFYHPDQHNQKEQTENGEGDQWVNAYTGYLFQIMYKLHGFIF